MRLAISISVATFLISSTAQADFRSGNDLLRECEAKGTSGYSLCLGYIMGVDDTMRHIPIYGFSECSSSEVTAGQIKDIVVQYLYNHPATRHTSASGIVVMAISESFPCR
jgi:Rap1a immunity proteins